MQVESGLLGVEESLKALAGLVTAEENAIEDAMKYILTAMCNYVVENGPWKDHTSNLRNGISVNIETMKECAAGETPPADGKTPIIRIEGENYVGCLSSAMEYSIWVELKSGFWVLQGAIDWMEPMMEKYFQDKMAIDKLDLIKIADISYSKFLSKKGMSESEISSAIQAKHNFYNGR